MSESKPRQAGGHAVVYAAKSTSDPHGSIPTQLADGRKLAAQRGFEVVAEEQDEAASAYHGDRGPGLAKAMAECERLSAEHGTSALIVQHSDRLARGDAKQARHLIEVVLWAIKSDVQLLSMQDPEMLAGGDMALLLGAIGGMRNHQDSKRKALAVKDGTRRRAERGEYVGSALYGYSLGDGQLAVVPAEAAVVRRIFENYASGTGQRQIVRALNEAGVPAPNGGKWAQSTITRMLRCPTYIGKVTIEGEVFDGKHEPIIDYDLWDQVQAVRSARHGQTGGRQADGRHLLVRGRLRCTCGSSMIPRKARRGVERDRYVCLGRIEHGPGFCSQPSIRRELIDEVFLATLLDGYIDLEATKSRIEDRAASALSDARQARAEAEAEVSQIDRALATTERDYDSGDITGKQYSARQERLTDERVPAVAAVDRAQAHVEQIEQGLVPGDAEQVLLDQLAALKHAVSAGVGAAPNLPALRNVIGDLFEAVHLVRSGEGVPEVARRMGEGFIPWHDDVPTLADGEQGYWLLLELRASAVDADTLRPMGQAMPVPWSGQYPPGFLCKYCWW